METQACRTDGRTVALCNVPCNDYVRSEPRMQLCPPSNAYARRSIHCCAHRPPGDFRDNFRSCVCKLPGTHPQRTMVPEAL